MRWKCQDCDFETKSFLRALLHPSIITLYNEGYNHRVIGIDEDGI